MRYLCFVFLASCAELPLVPVNIPDININVLSNNTTYNIPRTQENSATSFRGSSNSHTLKGQQLDPIKPR